MRGEETREGVWEGVVEDEDDGSEVKVVELKCDACGTWHAFRVEWNATGST